DAYVTGATGSIPTTPGAYQPANSGTYDAFVTKLAPNGGGPADLLYSTSLGGSDIDFGTGIAVDGSGNAYVTGRTYAHDFPTPDAFQVTSPGLVGPGNPFVATSGFVSKITQVQPPCNSPCQ